MDENKLLVSSSPHIRSNESTTSIMLKVLIALIPAIIASVIFFKAEAIKTLVVAVAACVATEAFINYIRKKPMTLSDGSAVVTGVLFALTLPPRMSIAAIIVGAVVAIAIGKQVFGGLGKNPFNPALVGRAFLMISYSVPMTSWITPDGVSGATPLGGAEASLMDLFLGSVGGSLGETSALALLIGGIFLMVTRVIDFETPLAFLGSVAIFALCAGENVLFHLLTGGVMLGAFFMATDYTTTPLSFWGNVIFGLGCGILTMVIRLFGVYPEGVMFSILIMNCFTPIINRFTIPKMYGRIKAKK